MAFSWGCGGDDYGCTELVFVEGLGGDCNHEIIV